MVFAGIEKLILAHKPIKAWCGECHNTTYQVYVEVEKPKYEDCHTYDCKACHTVRYYECPDLLE